MNVQYKFLCEHMFSFLLGIYLGVEFLRHMVTPRLTHQGTARLFSKVAAPFCIPIVHMRVQFLHILPNTCLFYYRQLSECEVVSHCGFVLCVSDG